MTAGQKIRKLRADAQITQLKLSMILYISQSTLSRYECGRRKIPEDMIETISQYFNIPTEYFAELEDMNERG